MAKRRYPIRQPRKRGIYRPALKQIKWGVTEQSEEISEKRVVLYDLKIEGKM